MLALQFSSQNEYYQNNVQLPNSAQIVYQAVKQNPHPRSFRMRIYYAARGNRLIVRGMDLLDREQIYCLRSSVQILDDPRSALPAPNAHRHHRIPTVSAP